jgi:hypothetical protein
MLPALIAAMIAFSTVAAAVTEVTLTNFGVVGGNIKSQQAFNIAEAGLNYYLWHLNHNATDYEDGQTGQTLGTYGYGPFVHNYVDTNGNTEGTYSLYISPPATGSTIVNVRSVGQAAGTTIKRTVQAQLGVPSFASYGVVSDQALWFGNTETADGPVFSNQGVRMDGPNTSTVSSANSTYVPSSQLGGDGSTSESGVWCNTSVTTPTNCNTRSKTDWLYPVQSIDFNQVTTSLCTIKKVAFAADPSTSSLATSATACSQVPTTRTAAYLPQRSTTYSSTRGYEISLNTNNTYDLYDVNAETDTAATASTALTTTLVASGIAIPSSGVIFAEDNVWIQSNGGFKGKVTVAAGRLTATSSSSYADINIIAPVTYAAKDGSDEIGMVSQSDVIVAPYAPPASGAFTFEVDAAVLAENGNVWYPDVYKSNANRCTHGWTASNQSMLFYGSVAARQTWTWSWLDGNNQCGDASYSSANGYISGFLNDTTQYDYNLTYGPPPSFPLTSGYNILGWREVLTRP